MSSVRVAKRGKKWKDFNLPPLFFPFLREKFIISSFFLFYLGGRISKRLVDESTHSTRTLRHNYDLVDDDGADDDSPESSGHEESFA